MRRVRGCSGLLRGFNYKPVPPKSDRRGHHGNCSLGPKGELGGWTQTELICTRIHTYTQIVPKSLDVMEMSDKTAEIKSLIQLCVQGCYLQARTSPPQKGQEAMMELCLQLHRQNSRRDDMQETQRTCRLI